MKNEFVNVDEVVVKDVYSYSNDEFGYEEEFEFADDEFADEKFEYDDFADEKFEYDDFAYEKFEYDDFAYEKFEYDDFAEDDFAEDEFAEAEVELECEEEYLFADEDELVAACAANGDKWYRNAISGAELLTEDQEVKLGMLIKAGQTDSATAELVAIGKEAQQELVEHNLRLVYKIASEKRYRKVDREDLVQEGNLGLIKAAEKFDYTKGRKFSTYATWWIRKNIRAAVKAAYDHDEHVEYYVEREDGDEDAYNDRFGADEHDCYADVLDLMVEQYVIDTLHKGIETLGDMEKKVITARYGIGGNEPLTIEELAKQLKMSKNGVRFFEESALKKLKNNCMELKDCV